MEPVGGLDLGARFSNPREHPSMSTFKTTLLLGLMTGLILAVGSSFGQQGLILALIVAAAMNIGSYWFSDKLVLRAYRAQPAPPERYARLHAMVEGLAARAGVPKPEVYILPSNGANAFATGRNPQHAAVAVTGGLLEAMDENELEGVLAHELGHILNRDILISSVAATLAGAITMLARFLGFSAMFGGYGGRDREGGGTLGALAMIVLAPVAALLIQMAISRTREFKADAAAAAIVGHPQGLISALDRLESLNRRAPVQASPATAHMFIVKPFSGAGLTNLFSTHPPIEERIRRLRTR